MKYCERDIVSTRFHQIEKLQIVKHFPCTAWWAHRGRVDRCGCAIIVLALVPLFYYPTLSFLAQPSVLPKSCRFLGTVFSASPPTIGASSCAKTILRTHDVDKSVRVLTNWTTSLRQYYDLWHTPADSSPEPAKPHVSVVIDARRRFPKFQMFESRWPPAPRLRRGPRRRSLALKNMNSHNGKISRFSMCFAMCGTNIQIFDLNMEIWIFNRWNFHFQFHPFSSEDV